MPVEEARRGKRGVMSLTSFTFPTPESALLADLAEAGGQCLVAELSVVAKGIHPPLTVLYGRIARFSDRTTHSEIWFQPLGDDPARRLVVPVRPWWTCELCWATFEAEGSHPVLVVTAPVPPGLGAPRRFDGMLVALVVDPAEAFSGPVGVVTGLSPYGSGRGVWPEILHLERLVAV
jgi:hypothetical protein